MYKSSLVVRSLSFLVVLFCMGGFISCSENSEQKPNVIIVMTDDQGTGDLSCQGNPYLKTPNLKAFYEKSVSLKDFHVSPLCTPTQSALITGEYPIRYGAWATFKGWGKTIDFMESGKVLLTGRKHSPTIFFYDFTT